MKQNLRLGKISGIPVGLNWGLLVVAVVYVFMLATQVLPEAAPGVSTPLYWLGAVAGVVLFFFSILLHELGHSLMAQRHGITVSAITLWLMGGVAQLKGTPQTPGAEFKIAVAGPAVNVVLAGLFMAGGLALDSLLGPGLAASLLIWLSVVNLVLAAFNLIPAAPLDGGRILAAITWKLKGNQHKGRRVAAISGSALGTTMLFLGVLTMLGGGGGIWFVLIGLFLRASARQELAMSRIHEAAQDKMAADVMVPLDRPVHGQVTLAGLAAMAGTENPETENRGAFPVLGSNGQSMGLVTHNMLTGSQSRKNADLPLADLALGWDKFMTAWDYEPVPVILERFVETGCNHALIYNTSSEQVGYLGVHELQAAVVAESNPKSEPVPV